MRYHRRQFVLGPRPLAITPGWRTTPLGNGTVLSHCPDLAVRRVAEGTFLVGHAACVLPGMTVEVHLANRDLGEAVHFLAGRFALLSGDRCFTDATGLLGLFYRVVEGEVWLASSPAILGAYLEPEAERIPWRVAHERGLDWVPAPFTTRRGVYKLPPQRSIEPLSGRIAPLAPLPDQGPDFATALVACLENWMRDTDGPTAIGLTGGHDSRTLVSAAKRTGLPFTTFTMVRERTKYADRHIPAVIAQKLGIHHEIYPLVAHPGGMAERRECAMQQMDGVLHHPVLEDFIAGMRYPPVVRVHGIGFEMAKCHYWNRLPETIPETEAILAAAFPTPPEPFQEWKAAFDVWRASLSDPVPLPMDWRDHFYVDQRLGAWAEQLYRASDLTDFETFVPANCLWIFRLMLSESVERRKNRQIQIDFISTTTPILQNIPINIKSFIETQRDRAKRLFRAAKKKLITPRGVL